MKLTRFWIMPKRFADLNTFTTRDRAYGPEGVKYRFADIERSGYKVKFDKIPPPSGRPPWIPPPSKRPPPQS